MKLYYHHVGVEGSTADFPKTVFAELPITVVENNVPKENTNRIQLLQNLEDNFPLGHFNCWGVPAGADRIIRNLSVGDAVLLVETTGYSGPIPALCIVKSYPNFELPNLSKALWGSPHYPYIFFFKTEELSLTWGDFLKHMDYMPTWDPRGMFYSVSENKLKSFGGAENYVRFLREKFSKRSSSFYSISGKKVKRENDNESTDYLEKVGREMEKLVDEALNNEPELTSGSEKIESKTLSSPRDAAFSRDIKRLYGARCAICGMNRVSPDEIPEVQSAHIYPKSKDGKDDLRNGICLCRLHHWAFDVGWIALNDDLTIIVRDDLPDNKDYDFIRSYNGKRIIQPIREELKPHPLYLRFHRFLHGFN